MILSVVTVLVALVSQTLAQVPLYGQCGVRTPACYTFFFPNGWLLGHWMDWWNQYAFPNAHVCHVLT